MPTRNIKHDGPSSAPLVNPILGADDHHGEPAPPPKEAAGHGGDDDGADADAPGSSVVDATAREEVGAEATVVGVTLQVPFSGDVPPNYSPLVSSNFSNPAEDDVGGGGGIFSEEGGADRQKEDDGLVDANPVGNAEDIPPFPPVGTGEGISGLDQGVAVDQKSKKDRKEFTAEEKLSIISEISTMPSVQSVLDKYGVSKSSLHRWRQPLKLERLHQMVGGSGDGGVNDEDNDVDADGVGGHVKPTNPIAFVIENRDKLRKRDLHDKLRLIKLGLQDFCKENMKRAENERLAITSSLIQLKAMEIKDGLLIHGEIQDKDELAAIEAFKASKSWACLQGNQLGYMSACGFIKWSDEHKSNTARYLETNSRKPSKKRKDRLEFTAEKKLAILQELEDINAHNKEQNKPAVTVEQICVKYATSKSSLHRWKQQYRSGRLQHLATTSSGHANSKRISTDKLHLIKRALNEFYVENENASPDRKIAINYSVLQAKAIEARDSMLKRHRMKPSQVEDSPNENEGDGSEGGTDATPEKVGENGGEIEEDGNILGAVGIDVMSKEEAHALESFKASSSWLRETAKKYGWRLDLDGKSNDGAMIPASAATVVYRHQDHPCYHDDDKTTEHVASRHHVVGSVQHAHDQIAMELDGMGNEVPPPGIDQGGHRQQHLTLAVPAYDGQGDVMEDVVVDFKNEESNTSCDV